MGSEQSKYLPAVIGFTNYVKALLAEHITRKCLEAIVSGKIEQFQIECLRNICTRNDISISSKCTECSTQNITNCPNNICNNLMNEIQRSHTFGKPSYKYTDAKQWSSNSWEIAKCYMPENAGYGRVSSPSETDFSGILSVMINHKMFQENNNSFEMARDLRNELHHSRSLEMTGEGFNEYLNTLISVLKDSGFIIGGTDAINELKKLRLMNVCFKLTENNLRSPIETENSRLLDNTSEEIISLVEQLGKRFQVELKLSNDDKVKFEVTQQELTDQPEKKEMPTLQPHDGKLIKLDDDQVQRLRCNVDNATFEGGFGTVYTSKEAVPGLDIRVVLKKITCKRNEYTKILTTYNEKISKRVMHFAVVPLIGYMEKEVNSSIREYYFLSPYLENGSLRACLKQGFEAKELTKIQMDFKRRIEILFQIASAICYLHTPVEGYRGIVLHMDLTSSNIVLDENFNARVIDFGLARELNEHQANVSVTQSKRLGTPGYFQTQSYSKLTVFEDCYNFGIVTREILTGKAPYIEQEGNKPDELRKQGKDYIRKILQKNIWNLEQTKQKEAADHLNELAHRCLKTKDISSEIIVEELGKIREKGIYTFCGCQPGKCFICIVNPSVKDKKGLSLHSCPIEVCLSCMRNSNLNPIICPTCGEIVIPEIGHTFAALLIAGNDLDNPALAKSFSADVTEIKDVLTSKYPCVIGISEENTRVVAPACPGQQDTLQDKILKAFGYLEKKKDINTLVFYYTGHFSPEDDFQLDDGNGSLSLKQLQKYFKKFCRTNEVKRILAFLDCCHAPKIKSIPDLRKVGIKIIQFNICSPSEEGYQMHDGSVFRTLFIQALTRKVFNKNCIMADDQSNCTLCKISGDFISIERILEYISNHITDTNEDKDIVSTPTVYASDGMTWKESCFGYNIDFSICFEFKFQEEGENTIEVNIECGIFCQIRKLKLSILQSLQNRGLRLPSTEYVDCLSLRIYNGRQNGDELQTMLQIAAAMDTEQCVIASVRNSSCILHGTVPLFCPTAEFNKYLKKQDYKIELSENAEIISLSKDELNKVTEDLATYNVLLGLNEDLIKVFKEWDERDNENIKQLTVSFPNVSSTFIVLELHRDEQE